MAKIDITNSLGRWALVIIPLSEKANLTALSPKNLTNIMGYVKLLLPFRNTHWFL